MEFNKLVSTKDIGLLIKTTRKAQGVTQEQLAGVANTGIRFISDLENGKPTIQVNKLLNVLSALGLGMYIFSKWDLNK
ncbi:MAG: helix-turn-helix transcriptional regulator [Succinivibrio sp.]|nr:helix-turn-helix transcriptional regulator [Succinivibrio sp.]MCI5577678.1 helix-turn-helix transcriptional regulator [Succinivibrio sp.]MCI6450472.1 helix-turn-helix transcriptional regulator [Succinivibrio sp.]MDD6068428.1 helix-turn-helix transcriptional regulator [Succinivibrio sp.]MDD7287492.1 helix-turn-helix transcriptional regulator [Succinivibrio sp.]